MTLALSPPLVLFLLHTMVPRHGQDEHLLCYHSKLLTKNGHETNWRTIQTACQLLQEPYIMHTDNFDFCGCISSADIPFMDSAGVETRVRRRETSKSDGLSVIPGLC